MEAVEAEHLLRLRHEERSDRTAQRHRAGAAADDDIRLRVTRSRDIRAPNLNDLFQGGSANSDSIRCIRVRVTMSRSESTVSDSRCSRASDC